MEWNYLDLTTTDPHWNLALEQYVFDRLPRDRSYFLLWQNDRSVIIGKHQNTPAEIDLPYVEAQGIQVVRRLSGGGAVYHDLGNLNFTFITDGEGAGTLDFALFCRPVVRVLESFGVSAQISGRNDITVCGKKFSGNSQYTREGRVMHHGTILFDSDLDAVTRALRVDEEKIRSKGVPSVRSRVTNLKEHLPPDVPVSLMGQYTPFGELSAFPELTRKLTRREYARGKARMEALGLKGFCQELSSADETFIPDWDF